MTNEFDGRCLVCGGRGGWPATYDQVVNRIVRCSRCGGTGIDPSSNYQPKDPT